MRTYLRVILIVSLVLTVQASAAFAAGTTDTGPGCGLGKLLWSSSKHPKNIAPQVFMALTNGTGMNTFAISTGTSGCTNDGIIMAEHKVTVFAAVNSESLAQEMAQGQGEHLASLATLMGLPAEGQPAFFAMTQEHYTSLVQAGDTSPVAMVKALNEAMAAHPVLAKLAAAR
jgi:hypothetical protein